MSIARAGGRSVARDQAMVEHLLISRSVLRAAGDSVEHWLRGRVGSVVDSPAVSDGGIWVD